MQKDQIFVIQSVFKLNTMQFNKHVLDMSEIPQINFFRRWNYWMRLYSDCKLPENNGCYERKYRLIFTSVLFSI